MARLPKEALEYWASIENEKGTLTHLDVNAPEIQKLRVLLGMDPVAKGNNLKLNVEKIEELRAGKGESRYVVSAKMGKHKGWLTGILRNDSVTDETVKKLATYFDVEERVIRL